MVWFQNEFRIGLEYFLGNMRIFCAECENVESFYKNVVSKAMENFIFANFASILSLALYRILYSPRGTTNFFDGKMSFVAFNVLDYFLG